MSVADLIIHDTTVLTMNTDFDVLPHHDVTVNGQFITAVTPTGLALGGGSASLGVNSVTAVTPTGLALGGGSASLGVNSVRGDEAPKARKELDGRGLILMPGLVNAHTHLGMSFFKGTAAAAELFEWLNWTGRYQKRMTPEDAYWSVMLAAVEMIRAGVTTFADMFFNQVATADAIADAGLRVCLGEAIMEPIGEAGRQAVDAQIDSAIRFIEKCQGMADGRISAWLAPHSLYACSERTIARVLEVAERMEELGFLEHRVLAAHCVHLSPSDIEILDRPTFGVAHNPGSNLKLQSGVAPLPQLVGRKMAVGLGTDGNGSEDTLDILKAVYLAAVLHPWTREHHPAHTVLAMITREGARALGLEDKVGTVKVGKKADLILLDLGHHPRTTPFNNPFYMLTFTARGDDVVTTIVDGKILMENRVIKSLDEAEVLHQAQARADRIFEGDSL
jgi:5-methylthioadenosine/S-adenosylhomocysteine deaminase